MPDEIVPPPLPPSADRTPTLRLRPVRPPTKSAVQVICEMLIDAGGLAGCVYLTSIGKMDARIAGLLIAGITGVRIVDMARSGKGGPPSSGMGGLAGAIVAGISYASQHMHRTGGHQ